MLIPDAVSVDDLPTVARRPGLFARRTIAPSVSVRESLAPVGYPRAALIGPTETTGVPDNHFLSHLEYTSRRFLVCDGRDIVLTRDAKSVAAPGYGLIDEFNVGGGRNIPPELFHNDLHRVEGGFVVDDGSVARQRGLSVPFCHYGQTAFGHFILDGLLQIYLFRRELAEGARLAHWLPPLPWIEPILARCGIPLRQRRPLEHAVVLLDRACLSSALAADGVYFPGPWSIGFFDWLRATFMDRPAQPSGERLYVRRQNTYSRRILNADAVEDLAYDHDFRIVTPEDLPFEDQMRLFSEAGTVMSAFGSGLTLSPLLAGPRQVVELLPASVHDAWFFRQAVVHGLNYMPIIQPSSLDGDFEADLPLLDQWLAALPR